MNKNYYNLLVNQRFIQDMIVDILQILVCLVFISLNSINSEMFKYAIITVLLSMYYSSEVFLSVIKEENTSIEFLLLTTLNILSLSLLSLGIILNIK